MLYPRKITQELKNWLFEKEIIILNGPRQVGKTSLLKLIEQELIHKKIRKGQIFYLNLEEMKILDTLNNDPENIFKYIINPKEKNYFLIDEIQYLDNPSNFLKHLYDKYAEKIKIITTGSSSLELKAKFQDSLAGRKVSFSVNPLDFEEFLIFKNFPYLNYLKKKELPLDIKKNFDNNLSEYLIYGGMPAIALQKNKTLKEKMLNEYVGTYINKDIRAIGKIENIAYFNNLMKILASQIGNLLNINELSNTTGISRRDIEKYLDLLEFTFVLDKILPFRKNTRAQVTKMPKIYFFDLGVRNAILGNFLDLTSRQDTGSLFENFVFLELKNKAKNKIFF
ncbi:ATP-binding protein, partial [Patescibacteria group bacterium]|nr:ATP-binding protein [Patescibacteria group bacterium]